MTLYDTPVDVLNKAMRGRGLDTQEVASQARLPSQEILSLGWPHGRTELPPGVDRILGLDARAFAGLRDYRPELPPCPGLSRIELAFGEESVNAWLIEAGDTALVIDAGFGPIDLKRALDKRRIDRCHLLITHGHRDHIGGIAAVRPRLQSFHAPAAIGGATAIRPGDRLQLGPFGIEVRDLRGHHPLAVGFQIDGLDQPLFATGDAVFAGSMGGCPNPRAFKDACRTIAESVLSRAPETILLTGHGPGTTLAQELEHNPFLAAMR